MGFLLSKEQVDLGLLFQQVLWDFVGSGDGEALG